MPVYQPREDSYLLQKWVEKFARCAVLDMGTGTGIQAITAAATKGVKQVLAVDRSAAAIKYAKKHNMHKLVTYKTSHLFAKVKGVFDVILFNPPYLPRDPKYALDATIEGGKRGWETIAQFLKQAGAHLEHDGIILLVFSSLTNKQKVEELIEENYFAYQELQRQRQFFEELYVYKIWKYRALLEVQKRGVKALQRLTKGHRGLVYTALYKGKRGIVKVALGDLRIHSSIEREGEYIQRLNKVGIAPKFFFSGEEFMVIEFIPGNFFQDFAEKVNKNQILQVLKDVLQQCRKMDELGLEKEEMHHPYKHIIVRAKDKKPFLIDFERMHPAEKPKNVTQFIQYLTSENMMQLWKKKKVTISEKKLRKAAQEYKRNQRAEQYRKILALMQ